MSTDVQVTYVNNSMNPDNPTIFVFTKNVIPTFNALVDGFAWRVMPDIGKGASSRFVYPLVSTVRATWGDCNATQTIEAQIGHRYTVLEDSTGIILQHDGQASQPTAIEVNSRVQVPGGVSKATVRLTGNPKDGYTFVVENVE